MNSNLTLTLAVADLDRTETFYRELLDVPLARYTPLPGGPELLLWRLGAATVLFREGAVLTQLHPAHFQDLERHPPGAGLSLEWNITALEPVLRRLEKRGWPLLYELEDDEHGRREVWLHDPDGYLLVMIRESS